MNQATHQAQSLRSKRAVIAADRDSGLSLSFGLGIEDDIERNAGLDQRDLEPVRTVINGHDSGVDGLCVQAQGCEGCNSAERQQRTLFDL